MKRSQGPRWREGGCHCGGVRFRAQIRSTAALSCNCSICEMTGFVHHIVEAADFELLDGGELLSTYRFGTREAKHTFCSRCGVKAFYTPRSHPNGVSVSVRCFDSEQLRKSFDIEPFDGRNWEQNIESIR